jgi:hypothetical protein
VRCISNVGEDGGCDEDIDVEKRQAVGGRRLTGAGLGVHFTYIESTEIEESCSCGIRS